MRPARCRTCQVQRAVVGSEVSNNPTKQCGEVPLGPVDVKAHIHTERPTSRKPTTPNAVPHPTNKLPNKLRQSGLPGAPVPLRNQLVCAGVVGVEGAHLQTNNE